MDLFYNQTHYIYHVFLYILSPEIPNAINYTVLGVTHELQKDDLK